MNTCIIVALSALVLALAPVKSVRAQEHQKADADAAFLSKVIPGIASSVSVTVVADPDKDSKETIDA